MIWIIGIGCSVIGAGVVSILVWCYHRIHPSVEIHIRPDVREPEEGEGGGCAGFAFGVSRHKARGRWVGMVKFTSGNYETPREASDAAKELCALMRWRVILEINVAHELVSDMSIGKDETSGDTDSS